MHVSVRVLFDEGKRRSPYAILSQRPAVGWLVYGPSSQFNGHYTARLLDDAGRELLEAIERAEVVEIRGRPGMHIAGVQYRARGVKHSNEVRQEWWAQAPPVAEPLIDHAARVRAGEEEFARQRALLERDRGD